MRLIVISVACAACAPAPPFATLETADTLRAGQFSATAYGGAGAGSNNSGFCCGGGGARLRYGLDGRQEIGVDAEVLDDGNAADFGAKLAYKRRLAPWFAIVAGVGGTSSSESAYGNTLGGDVGAVASTPGPGVQAYGSLRVTAAGRLGSNDPRASEGGLAAVGLALPVGPLRLLGELGGIAALQQAHSQFDVASSPIVTSDSEGFYIAGGLAYTWH